MNTELIHIYFVPGLAASKEIFRNISMDPNRYEVHIIDWIIPKKKESLAEYAQRMALKVAHPHSVLIGVSFGGVVAQEMSQYLQLKQLMIISSVKTRFELPRRMRLAKKTKAYKLLPTGWALSIKDLTKLAIGPRSKRRLQLYQEYLWVRDKNYLDWAIENMVCWQREVAVPRVVHIHGDQDPVFPIRYINDANVLEGGTHIMILNKGSRISKILDNILSST